MQRFGGLDNHKDYMFMKTFIPVLIASFTLCTSCSKQSVVSPRPQLEGKWRLIEVKDIANDSLVAQRNSTESVIVDFVGINESSGIMYANTTFNKIETQFLAVSATSIKFPQYVCAKTYDSAWGRAFLDNIGFAESYTLAGTILSIKTGNLMVLRFTRQ